ncbi:MAG TPA: FAD-dependent oxidoreductase, partial [Anaerolineae bacterium]|nr:FAD-dependent oxidoreductase [Anaerolineae bacterium]
MASLQDAFGLISAVRPELILAAPLAFTNMQAWSQRLGATDRTFKTYLDAQLLISAQGIAADTNALYGAAALDLYRRGVAHVEGGIGNLAETLAAAVKANGGRILYRHEVTSIRRGDLHSRSHVVRTKRGTFEADAIIANLTPWALTKLLGEDAPASLKKRTSGLKPSWGAFTLYLGVDAEAIEDGIEHHQVVVNPDQPLGEGNSVFVSISPAWDASRAPKGQRAITISTHTRVSDWYQLANDENAFEDRKNLYTEKLIDAALIALPKLRSNLRLILPGTPLTIERYTGRVNGMVGGFPQTSVWSSWSPKIDRNLWLVGDSIFPGQSTAGVSLGALRVAREVERSVEYKKVGAK